MIGASAWERPERLSRIRALELPGMIRDRCLMHAAVLWKRTRYICDGHDNRFRPIRARTYARCATPKSVSARSIRFRASPTGFASRRRARRPSARPSAIVRAHGLVTVCEEAGCPNIGECWVEEARHLHDHGRHLHARLRLLRREDGPARRARSRRAGNASPTPSPKLGLEHVVITSVDRDDLDDGGAEHFARTIRAIRAAVAGHDRRGPDARLPAQARRARGGDRRQARRLQPQPRNRAAALSQDPPRRALLREPAPAAAGQGDRPADLHQVRPDGRPGRDAAKR